MESKEILKEFARKLAGLSAAAKVVAIAGAVSTYSGTGHAAAESDVKAENRLVTVAQPNEKKSEEVSAKKEEPAKTQVSEVAVKTLLASQEKTTAAKANIAPKIQEKVNIYEPKKESASQQKYDTRYYRAPGTTSTSNRASRRSSSRSYSPYNYDQPTAPSYVKGTSDDSAFGEDTSSSRSTSAASRSSRRSYRDWGRTRTNSDYGSTSKDTDSKSKTDGIGRSGVSTASSSQSTGFASFSGFGDGNSRVSAPKNDAKTEKALKIAEEIERGEKMLVTSIEKKRAIELQQEVRQGKKKLVDADEAERINEQQANVARAENEVRQLRNELQVVRAENLELKGRQGGLQQQAANLQILPQANVAQVQPQVVAQVQPVQPVVQPVNAAVPPPPPPPVQGADPNLNVIVGNGAGVPPPPPPPPPVQGADPNLNVIVGNGAGVPPPPPPPPPPGVANTNGVPPPPGVPNAPVFVAPVVVEPDFDALFNEVAVKADAALAQEKAERDAETARAAEEAVNLFAAAQGMLEKFKNPPAKFDKDKELTRLRDRFARTASMGHKKMESQAFYACCLAVLGEARRASSMPEESDERMIFEEAFRAAAAEILLSIACAGNTDENRKAFVDCCEVYAVEFGDVRKATKTTSFTREETAKCAEVLEKCGDVAGAVADQPAVAADQCSALDKAIFSTLGEKVRSKGWYEDDELAALIEKQKKIIAGMDPKTKKMPGDLDAAKKDEIKKLLLKLNSIYWLKRANSGLVDTKISDVAKDWDVKCTLQLKKLIKSVKFSQVLDFKPEMEKVWSDASKRVEGKGESYGTNLKRASEDQFDTVTGLKSMETKFRKEVATAKKMELFPVVSKLRKAVMNGENLLSLTVEFDDDDLALMKDRLPLVKKLLKTVLKFSKNTNWVLKGTWVGEFLPSLPKENVTALTVEGAEKEEAGRKTKELVLGSLASLSVDDCPKLTTLTFDTVELTRRSLSSLKPGRNVQITFKNVDAPDFYKEDGELKRLKDATGKEPQYNGCPWAKDGVRPVAVAADPVNPQQNGGRRGLRGIGGNGNVAVENANGRQQNDPLAGVRLRPRPQDPQGNAPVGERNKNDVLANFINNLKAIDNKQERDSEILQFHQELWEAHADLETVELNVPLATFDMTGSLRDLVKAAVQHANKSNKPLALVGSFNGRHFESIKDITGDVVRGLDGLKMSLQFAFSYEGGYEIEFTRWVLETIDNLKNSADDPVTNPPQSVELDRIIPKGEILNALARLKLDTVKFSNLDKCGTITKDMQGRITDTRFDAWKKDIDFSEHGWKNLLIKTKTVDFSTNCIRESLDGLKRLLGEMAPGDNAQEGDNPQPPEPVRLEEIILPEDMNAADVTAIKALVEGLKSGQH